jgi:hypothetical protein
MLYSEYLLTVVLCQGAKDTTTWAQSEEPRVTENQHVESAQVEEG